MKTIQDSAVKRTAIHNNVSQDKLVLVCVRSVADDKESCTFERLVAECFKRFPATFSFKRYPKWPDSQKLDRSLRRLRTQGLIVGSIPTRFQLTRFGRSAALSTEKTLEACSGRKGRAASSSFRPRSGDDRLMDYLQTNPLFRRFLKNQNAFDLTEAEFRSLLRSTLETPTRVLKQNFLYLRNLANAYRSPKLVKFLDFCAAKRQMTV